MLGLLLFLAVMSLVTYFSFAHFRQDALDERLMLARTVAQSLDSMVERTFQSLRHLPAQLPELDDSAADELRAYRFQSLFREAVFVLDADGRALVSDPPFSLPTLRPPLPERETVTPLLETPAGRPVLVIAQPFRRQNREHLLVAELSPRGSVLSTFLQSLAPEAGLHIVVVDRHGRVIAAADQRHLFRTAEPAELLGERIASHRSFLSESSPCTACGDHGPEQGGEGYLTVMAPLRLAPWGVMVQQHRRLAFASLYNAQTVLLGAVGLLLIAGLVLSRAVSRSVVAPIEELSRQAEGLRRGNLQRPIAVEGDREIRMLASTLDGARQRLARALAELEELNQGLERQVADRTRKLRAQDAQRKTLVRRLLHAGEEERRRLARELHDEISQLLAVIQLSLSRLEPERSESGTGLSPAKIPALEKARNLLSKTQKEVHRIIYDLRPSILDDLGLAAAVRWYAENALEPRGIDVHLEVEEGLALPAEVEITVFRIYQEIVTNILRHSEADHVSIELYITGDTADGTSHHTLGDSRRLHLSVEDDGVGFVKDERSGGAGILGMRERADLIGGRLALDSDPGLGTQVQLEIPLRPETPAESPVESPEDSVPEVQR